MDDEAQRSIRRAREDYLANIAVTIPWIVATHPDLDDWEVLRVFQDLTGRARLDPETLQTALALTLRERLRRRSGAGSESG